MRFILFSAVEKDRLKTGVPVSTAGFRLVNLTTLFTFKETYTSLRAEPFKFFIIGEDLGKSGSIFEQVVWFVESKSLETDVTHRVFGVEQVPQATFEHHQRFPVETVLDQPASEVSPEFDLVKAVAQQFAERGNGRSGSGISAGKQQDQESAKAGLRPGIRDAKPVCGKG